MRQTLLQPFQLGVSEEHIRSKGPTKKITKKEVRNVSKNRQTNESKPTGKEPEAVNCMRNLNLKSQTHQDSIT